MNRYLLTIALLVLLTLLSATNLSARTVHVPADFQTIQEGVNAADDGDTVLIGPGLYVESVQIRGLSLVLGSLTLTTGNPAYIDSTVIDANQRASVITISDGSEDQVKICGLTIANGRTAGNGGGICCTSYSRIELEDLLITGSIADDDFWAASGGGLSVRSVETVLLHRVRIIGNQIRGNGGGGVDLREVNSATLTDCAILRNESNYMGGGLYDYHCNLTMNRVVIAENIGGWLTGGGFMHHERGTLRLDHVTIADNRAGYYGGAFYANPSEGSFVTNSIIYGNTSGEGDSLIYLDGPIDFTYCDIEGGDSLFRGGPGEVFSNIIVEDPRFVNPGADNYQIAADSPCRNAGDPNSEMDRDRTRADMGALPYLFRGGYIGGVVLDYLTEERLEGAVFHAENAMVDGMPEDLRMVSDADGVWGDYVYIAFQDTADIEFVVTALEHSNATLNVTLAPGDSVWFEVRLYAPSILIEFDSIRVELDSAGLAGIPFTVWNEGEGALDWSAESGTVSEASFEPGAVRQTMNIGEITGDDRIEGVAFDGERFYFSGANGADSSMIYIVSREGELLDTFAQAAHSRYGMKDLDWDGELLWGTGDSLVYGFETDGTLQRRWRAPFSPATYIACEPLKRTIWFGSIDRDIRCFDRDGNDLNVTLSRMGLRIYGLAWYDDDPDGYRLYVLNDPGGDALPSIYKMNVATNDTIKVADLEVHAKATGIGGAFICTDYDYYGAGVLAYTVNIPAVGGGDQMEVLQLQANDEWLVVEPTEGTIEAGDHTELQLFVRTAAEDVSWAFDRGEYDGMIEFTHNSAGSHTVIPVHLLVREMNAVPELDQTMPSEIDFIGAYPQPFNSTLTIAYRLDAPGRVSLTVSDLLGREVLGRTGVAPVSGEFQSAGEHRVNFDAAGLPSGIYLARLEAGGRITAVKVVCLK